MSTKTAYWRQNMKRKLPQQVIFCLATLILLSLLLACTAPPPPATPPEMVVTDQLGRQVSLKTTPRRIISLAPSNTEILFALGLAERVVAVTDFCNYPPEATEKPSIGGFSTPNIEEIIALSPDLVVATSIHDKKVIPQLEAQGITVVALNPKTIDEVLTAITLVGRITGAEEAAAAVVTPMQQRIKSITDKTKGLPPEQRPATLYILWHDPLMTAGAGTLPQALIDRAGGTNIGYEIKDYGDISLEAVIDADPAVIIAGIGHGTGADAPLQYAQNEPRLKDTTARRQGNIYAINSDLPSRGGPRIVDALEQFARFIHPEAFK